MITRLDDPLHPVWTKRRILQVLSLQDAIQAVDYTNRCSNGTNRRYHSYRPEVNGAPEFLQHRHPEYKGTEWWPLKFWIGKGKTITLRGITIRAAKDGQEELSVDCPKPLRTSLPLALIPLFRFLLLAPLGTPEIMKGLHMFLPFLVESSSIQGAVRCEKEI